MIVATAVGLCARVGKYQAPQRRNWHATLQLLRSDAALPSPEMPLGHNLWGLM